MCVFFFFFVGLEKSKKKINNYLYSLLAYSTLQQILSTKKQISVLVLFYMRLIFFFKQKLKRTNKQNSLVSQYLPNLPAIGLFCVSFSLKHNHSCREHSNPDTIPYVIDVLVLLFHSICFVLHDLVSATVRLYVYVCVSVFVKFRFRFVFFFWGGNFRSFVHFDLKWFQNSEGAFRSK